MHTCTNARTHTHRHTHRHTHIANPWSHKNPHTRKCPHANKHAQTVIWGSDTPHTVTHPDNQICNRRRVSVRARVFWCVCSGAGVCVELVRLCHRMRVCVCGPSVRPAHLFPLMKLITSRLSIPCSISAIATSTGARPSPATQCTAIVPGGAAAAPLARPFPNRSAHSASHALTTPGVGGSPSGKGISCVGAHPRARARACRRVTGGERVRTMGCTCVCVCVCACVCARARGRAGGR